MYSVTHAYRSDPATIPPGSMYYGKCRLLFNEVNIFPDGAGQFLELKKICEGSPDKAFGVRRMEKYKLLFVSNEGYLVTVCKLEGTGMKEKNEFFFVIGGDSVQKKSMNMKNCNFASDYTETAGKRFPTGDIAPVGIMLVHNEKESVLQDLDLENSGTAASPQWRKVKISSGGKIMNYLQDMVIVTTSSPYTECVFFRNFYSGYRPGERSILRDWGQGVSNDVSLSRCPTQEDNIFQFRPFQAGLFSVAQKSPGEENNCIGAFKFYIEDTQPKRKRPRMDFVDKPGHECKVTTEDRFIDSRNLITNPLTYATMLQLEIDRARCTERIPEMSTTTQSPPVSAPTQDPGVHVGLDLEENLDIIEEEEFVPNVLSEEAFVASLIESGPYNRQTCEHLESEPYVIDLKSPGQHLLDWRDVLDPRICTWFDFLGFSMSPSGYRAPKYRCKLCNKLLSQGIIVDRPGSRYINKIMKSGQGIGGRCAKSDNKRLIQKHLENPLHQIALDFIELFEEGYRGAELKEKFMERGRPYRNFLESTEQLFVTCFQGVRLDITFFKCQMLRELLEYFGVDLGHLYANPSGMRLIVMSISDTMHKSFVEQLKRDQPEFSLLLDLSTDVSTLSCAAFLFQTYDENRNLRIYVYRVIWVQDETSDEIFSTFLREIRLDGLEQYVKEKCIGYASDSGSNVLRFRELLQQHVDHQLVAVKCYAHRLENAHKAAWKTQPYLHQVDVCVNNVYRIFHMSAKKKRILQVQMVDLGDTSFTIKRYHTVRWIAGKRRALMTLLNHWKTIVRALEEISTDMSFSRDQRQEAQETVEALKESTFVSHIAFAVDVSDAIAEMSLGLQIKGTSLIGKKKMRDGIIRKLTTLKTTNGKHLKEVLESSHPVDEQNPTYKTTLEDFELRKVKFNLVQLKEADPNSLNLLHRKRAEYIDSIVTEISNRFPRDATDGFDIFDPTLWPERQSELDTFGNNRLRLMSRDMLWNFRSEDLLPEWKQLKASVVDHPEFSRRKLQLPEEFWSFYLKDEAGINWPGSLKTIITNILTAPASTAEVERIFSYYTATKTVRRYRLDVTTVDAIIRIKFNGPKKLKDFQAIEYIPDFLKSHSRSDDTSIPATRQRLYRGDNEDLSDGEEDIIEPSGSDGL